MGACLIKPVKELQSDEIINKISNESLRNDISNKKELVTQLIDSVYRTLNEMNKNNYIENLSDSDFLDAFINNKKIYINDNDTIEKYNLYSNDDIFKKSYKEDERENVKKTKAFIELSKYVYEIKINDNGEIKYYYLLNKNIEQDYSSQTINNTLDILYSIQKTLDEHFVISGYNGTVRQSNGNPNFANTILYGESNTILSGMMKSVTSLHSNSNNFTSTIYTEIGTLFDEYIRDVFKEYNKGKSNVNYEISDERIENISKRINKKINKEYFRNLLINKFNNQKDEIISKLKKQFGDDFKVISDFPKMVTTSKRGNFTVYDENDNTYKQYSYLTGSVDLIVVDKNGIAHVVDVKFSKEDVSSVDKYKIQVLNYTNMLKSQNYDIKDRVGNPFLLQISSKDIYDIFFSVEDNSFSLRNGVNQDSLLTTNTEKNVELIEVEGKSDLFKDEPIGYNEELNGINNILLSMKEINEEYSKYGDILSFLESNMSKISAMNQQEKKAMKGMLDFYVKESLNVIKQIERLIYNNNGKAVFYKSGIKLSEEFLRLIDKNKGISENQIIQNAKFVEFDKNGEKLSEFGFIEYLLRSCRNSAEVLLKSTVSQLSKSDISTSLEIMNNEDYMKEIKLLMLRELNTIFDLKLKYSSELNKNGITDNENEVSELNGEFSSNEAYKENVMTKSAKSSLSTELKRFTRGLVNMSLTNNGYYISVPGIFGPTYADENTYQEMLYVCANSITEEDVFNNLWKYMHIYKWIPSLIKTIHDSDCTNIHEVLFDKMKEKVYTIQQNLKSINETSMSPLQKRILDNCNRVLDNIDKEEISKKEIFNDMLKAVFQIYTNASNKQCVSKLLSFVNRDINEYASLDIHKGSILDYRVVSMSTHTKTDEMRNTIYVYVIKLINRLIKDNLRSNMNAAAGLINTATSKDPCAEMMEILELGSFYKTSMLKDFFEKKKNSFKDKLNMLDNTINAFIEEFNEYRKTHDPEGKIKIEDLIKSMTNGKVFVYPVTLEKSNGDQYKMSLSSSINFIVDMFKDVVPEVSEPSVRIGDKTYHAYCIPSFSGKVIKVLNKLSKENITTEEEYIEFCKKYNVEHLMSSIFYTVDDEGNLTFRNNILEYIKSGGELRCVNIPVVFGEEVSRMNGAARIICDLKTYFYELNKNEGKIMVNSGTISNKQANKYYVVPIVTQEFNKTIEDTIVGKIYDLFFMQEIERMKAVYERSGKQGIKINQVDVKYNKYDIQDALLNPNSNNQNILNSLKQSGLSFRNISYLNKLLFSENLTDEEKEVRENIINCILGIDKVKPQNVEKIQNIIKDEILSDFNKYVDIMDSLGMFKTQMYDGNIVLKELHNIIGTSYMLSEEDIRDMEEDKISEQFINNAKSILREYFFQNIFALKSMQQLVFGDPSVTKNSDDYCKRSDAIQTPASKLNPNAKVSDNEYIGDKKDGYKASDYTCEDGKVSSTGKINTICISDSFMKSMSYDEAVVLFDKKIEELKSENADENMIKALESQKEKFIESIKSSDIVNAQAYITPTGYRKIMTMAGKFNQKDEVAYHESMTGRNSGRKFMRTLKTTSASVRKIDLTEDTSIPAMVRQKHTITPLSQEFEYAGSQSEKLMALFDFMENSHYKGRCIIRFNKKDGKTSMNIYYNGKVISYDDYKSNSNKYSSLPNEVKESIKQSVENIEKNLSSKEEDNGYEVAIKGKYTGNGIDLIQPESAIKTGAMNVVDINEEDSYEDVYEKLSDSIYDKNGEYSNDSVNETNANDFGDQQNLPMHFRNGKHGLGTQTSILMVSDISEGAQFNDESTEFSFDKSSYEKEYQKLYSKLIEMSAIDVLSDFAIGSDYSDAYLDELERRGKTKEANILRKSKLERRNKISKIVQGRFKSIILSRMLNQDNVCISKCNEMFETLDNMSLLPRNTRVEDSIESLLKEVLNKIGNSKRGIIDELTAYNEALEKYYNLFNSTTEFNGVGEELNRLYEDKENKLSTLKESINNSKEVSEAIDEVIVSSIVKLYEDTDYSKYIKNYALSSIIKNAVINDYSMSINLLRAVSLDEEGNFFLPLSDRMYSVKIQQLINSIIRERVNKVNLNGGKVTQMSSFGMSENLKVVYNEDGTSISHYECIIPFPSDEIENFHKKGNKKNNYNHKQQYYNPSEVIESLKTELEKSPFWDKLEGDNAKEKIANYNDMLTMFCYRIPTEDKYSIIPIRPVGWYNSSCGEAIILPAEITNVTGCDFDADAMYTHYKTISVNNGVYSVEYCEFNNGSVDTDTDNYNKIANTFMKMIEMRLRSNECSWMMNNIQNFNEQKKLNKIYAIIESEDYSFEELYDKDENEINSIYESINSSKDVSSLTNNYELFNRNAAGDHMIGIEANANIAHNAVTFMEGDKIHFNTNPNETEDTDYGFTLVDTKIDDDSVLDENFNKDGIRISNILGSNIGAAADTAKEPSLNGIHFTPSTSSIYNLLERLGFSTKTTSLFMCQPIIKELYSMFENEKINTGYSFINLEDFIDDTVDALIDYISDGDASEKIKLHDLWKKYTNGSNDNYINISKEELLEGFNRGNILSGDIGNVENDIKMLALLKRLSSISRDLGSITSMTKKNSTNQAAGPNISNTTEEIEKMKSIDIKYFRYGNSNSSNSKIDINLLEKLPMIKAKYDYTIDYESEVNVQKFIFDDHFIEMSILYSNIKEAFRNSVKMKPNAKIYSLLAEDLINFMATRNGECINNNLKDFFWNTLPKLISIIKENKWLSNKFNLNVFTKNVIINSENVILFNTKGVDSTKGDIMSGELDKMIVDDSKLTLKLETYFSKDEIININNCIKTITGDDSVLNEDKIKFSTIAKLLLNYWIYKSGFGFESKEGSRYASPSSILLSVPYYKTMLNKITDISGMNEAELENMCKTFILQFKRNRADELYGYIPEFEFDGSEEDEEGVVSYNASDDEYIIYSDSKRYSDEENSSTNSKVTIFKKNSDIDEENDYVDTIIIKTYNNSTFEYEDVLCQFVSSDTNASTVTYKPVERLGGEGFIDYDYSDRFDYSRNENVSIIKGSNIWQRTIKLLDENIEKTIIENNINTLNKKNSDIRKEIIKIFAKQNNIDANTHSNNVSIDIANKFQETIKSIVQNNGKLEEFINKFCK